MITASCIGVFGRLGNQLFQISATIGIARKNKAMYAFHPWVCNYTEKDMQCFFSLPLPKISSEQRECVIYREKGFEYKDVILDQQFNWDLFGYWQSEKYFAHCKEEVLSYFKPSQMLIQNIASKYKDILLTPTTCSIHVRRGDYVGNSSHEYCNVDYYKTAIQYMRDKCEIDKFVVFSDDIEFCKFNFPLDFVFINNNLSTKDNLIHRRNDSDVEELFLMSLCSHNIISNSSFSWWGSYLNKNKNKIIVAPKKWLLDGTNDSDIYTEQMIRL